MKLNHTILLTILSFALFFTACNSGSKSSASKEDTKDEMKTEENSMANLSGTFAIDKSKSKAMFKGVMLGVKEHTGYVNFNTGSVTLQNGQVTGGNFVVDMNSITPTDKNYSEEQPKEKLVGHLKSPDFFDVENHPVAKFEVIGSSPDGLKGTLTIRGVNNEVTVKNVKMEEMGDEVKMTGDMTFNRKNYNVSFDMPVADMVISNDVEMDIELIAKK